MHDKIKIAAVQMAPELAAHKRNMERILAEAGNAASNAADLVVFPECALTGYVFTSREEALPSMESIPGPSTEQLIKCCQQFGILIVAGMLEIDNDRYFNAAVLLGPEGLVGKYRKNHLPFLGIDRFVDPGDGPFRVYSTPIGNIGLYICYDCNFPESSRVMALQGAEILVLPTNWPQVQGGRGEVIRNMVNTRAFENRVHLVAVDRVGEERGVRFLGHSKIADASGNTAVEGSNNREETLYAEVSLAEARQKHIVIWPGQFEIDYTKDRRSELYGKIVEPVERNNS